MLDILLGLAGLFAALFLLQRRRSAARPFPPGPKGYPIVGNVDLPNDNTWEYFARMAKEYGEQALVQVLVPLCSLPTDESFPRRYHRISDNQPAYPRAELGRGCPRISWSDAEQ